ncbi:hypothetical protein GGI11_003448 [Coemansia sp. RSA 2049]|nr:hypothetical protein GGI11_003448 [Coemansia sp. RSA 2049]
MPVQEDRVGLRGSQTRRSDRGHSGRRLRINVLYESETVTSDEDFLPRSATAAAAAPSTGRPRGRPRRNTAQHSVAAAAASANGVSDDVQRQTRGRRIAIDSDEEEEEGYDGGAGGLDVDIDGLSVSDNEHMSSQNGGSNTRRAATRHSTRTAAGSSGANAEQRQTRGARPHRRSTANGYGLRGSGAGEAVISSDSDDGASVFGSDHEAEANHAPTNARIRRQNGNARVSRPRETIEFSDTDSSMFSVLDDMPSSQDPRSSQRQGGRRGRTQKQGPTNSRSNTSNQAAASTLTASGDNSIGAAGYSQHSPTDWILATTPSTVPYRPQIGDIVVYFREGHEDFWNSPLRCKKLNEKLLPYTAVPSLPLAVYGKVVGLRYAVGPPSFCTVKIQTLQSQTIDEMDLEDAGSHELTRKCIQVQYHDCEGVPDFIILYSRYRASLRSALKTGDSVSVLFDEDQAHRATITGFRDIKSSSRQTNVTRLIARNPWKCITVEWVGAQADGDSKTEQVSPWELVHDDDSAEAEIPDDIKRSLLNVVGGLRSNPQFVWFVHNVDYVTEYPDYLLNVAYPMCLNTVYERIDNGFYRHLSAVSFDMALIQDNADTFNDPGTPVPIAAQQLMAKYKQLLDRALENGPHARGTGSDESDGFESDSQNSGRLQYSSSRQRNGRPQPAVQSSSPRRQTRGSSRRSSSGHQYYDDDDDGGDGSSAAVKSEPSDDDSDSDAEQDDSRNPRKRKTRSANYHTTSRKRRASRRTTRGAADHRHGGGGDGGSRSTRSTRQRQRNSLDADGSDESDYFDSDGGNNDNNASTMAPATGGRGRRNVVVAMDSEAGDSDSNSEPQNQAYARNRDSSGDDEEEYSEHNDENDDDDYF